MKATLIIFLVLLLGVSISTSSAQTEKKISDSTCTVKQGGKSRCAKFVDKDGDGINDNRCRGMGVKRRGGQGRKHCR